MNIFDIYFNKCKFIVLLLLFLAIPLSYLPAFFYSNYRNIILYALTFCATVCFFRLPYIFKEKFFFKYIVLVLTILICLPIYIGIGVNFDILDFKMVILPLLFMLIGYNYTLKDNIVINIIFSYAIALLIISWIQIHTNIGGFIIEKEYLVDGKNAIGPMLGVVHIISVVFLLSNKFFTWKKILLISFCVFSYIFLLTIRARTAIILVTMIDFSLLYGIKKKKLLLSIVFLIFLCCISNMLFSNNIFIYVYDSLFLNHENNFTSDRTNRMMSAISVLEYSPLWGRLCSNITIKWVHNYPLRILSDYGLVGGLFFILLYLLTLKEVLYGVIKENISNIYNIGYILAFFAFGISMAEPLAPYGPGTTFALTFFLLGWSLRKRRDSQSSIQQL